MMQDRDRTRRLFLAFAMLLLCGSARAQGPARLVHDFFPDEYDGSSPVSQLTPVASRLFFTADDLDTGRTVWRTDGTAAGTERVPVPRFDDTRAGGIVGRLGDRVLWLVSRDAEPDVESLIAAEETGVGVVLHTHRSGGAPWILQSRVYFQDCGDTACRIWSSDGTPAGTRPVPALSPFRAVPQEIVATVADRWLVFRSRAALLAYDAARDRVLTLMAGGAARIQVFPTGQTLYVVTDNGRRRLWASSLDAPRAVSLLAADYIDVMGWLGDSLYFATGNEELWTTEGRPGSTRTFPGFPVDPFSRLSDKLGAIGTKVFLPDPGYYWGGLLQVDPVARTTKTLYTLCSGKYDCLVSRMSNVTVLGNQGLLTVNGELWRSDGTRGGTRPNEVLQRADADTFRVLGDRLLLGATSRDGEQQLWQTDGSAEGTRSLTDATPDRPFKVESPPVPFAGALLVAADQKPVGEQLWRVEGGHAEALTDLRHLAAGIGPLFAATVGDRIVFERQNQPWSAFSLAADGSTEALGTELERCQGWKGPCLLELVPVGGRLVFASGSDGGLWSTDGTAAGTRALSLSPRSVLALGSWRGEALAVCADGGLWASDGTEAGTRLVAHMPIPTEEPWAPVIAPVSAGSRVYLFRRTGGFNAGEEAQLELWITDGTEAGTVLLAALPFPGENRPYPAPQIVGGRLFFRFFGVLWTSDGSAAGTAPIPHQPPGRTFALGTGNGVLYAGSGEDDGSGESLWSIDPGTLEATLLVSAPLIGEGYPGHPLGSLLDGTLLLRVREADDRERWWVTDGTPASTHPVATPLNDLVLSDFQVAGDRRYFTACDPEHGCELWSTNRSGDDTHLVQDLWPGARSSDPTILEATGSRLLFAATNPDTGRELWAIDVAQSPD